MVCLKNEEEGIRKLVQAILNQNYDEFELVLVNDYSTDSTELILNELSQMHSQISLAHKEQFKDLPGKKYALQAGVKAAKHQYIVVTDADCLPVSKNWLQLITAPLFQGKEIVLGLSPNTKHYAFWRNFFRYETYITALQYASFSIAGIPYMGVGRNMAFTKSIFQQHFESVINLQTASGDDDLFINAAATKANTALVADVDSFTISSPPKKIINWWRQKTRHLTAGPKYKVLHQILLAAFPISALVFLVSSFILLFTPVKALAMLALLAYFFTISVVHVFGLRRFYCEDLVLESPLYLLMWMITVLIIAIASQFKSKKEWN